MRDQVLGGRYRIIDKIGEGGMAFVYLALDEKLGRKVAIKVLHEHMERNPDIRRRFQLEAQAISLLEHPNIVKIYDFAGETAERLWIVTEVIRGKNLAQFLQQFTGGWLHPVISACIVREICKALGKAHSHHIVHRDIKPENVMLTVEGRVKLMDFGIAKDLGKNRGMTMTGTFMGSPSYMSPEQIRGRDVDHRSDLYSLSVLFYEVVTGRLPFTGQTTHDVVLKIMEGQFTHPRFIVPSLPEAMNDAVLKGMAKDPLARFQSAQEYGETLDQILTSLGFDESHVELERYVRDRQAYEQRLAQTRHHAAGANSLAQRMRQPEGGSQMLRQPLPRTKTPAPQPPRAPQTREPHKQQQPPQAPTRPFKVEETWAKQLAHSRRTPLPQPPRQKTPMPQPPAMNPRISQERAAPTQILSERQLVNFHAAAAVQVPAPQVTPPRRAAPAPQLRQPVRQRLQRQLPRNQTDGWGEYLFGFCLVGLVAVISMWGFWELQNRLPFGRHVSAPAQRAAAAANHIAHQVKLVHHTQRRNGTPPQARPLQHKPPTDEPQVVKIGHVSRIAHTKVTLPAPAPVKKSPHHTLKGDAAALAIDLPTPAPAVLPAAPTPTNPVVQASTPAPTPPPKHRPTPVSQPVNDTDDDGDDDGPGSATSSKDDSHQTPAPTPAPKPVKEPKAAIGKGKVTVSSQPAAEIFIDGKHLGTTIDNTTDSGWLPLNSGHHVLELRRQGYNTFHRTFDLGIGEQKTLQRTVLDQGGDTTSGQGASAANTAAGSGATVALTLRINLVPADVTIRNLDTNVSQAFVMKSTTKTVSLAAGRYHVKIDHQGDVKERDLSLSPATGQMTFSADFKGDE